MAVIKVARPGREVITRANRRVELDHARQVVPGGVSPQQSRRPHHARHQHRKGEKNQPVQERELLRFVEQRRAPSRFNVVPLLGYQGSRGRGKFGHSAREGERLRS